MNFNIKQRGRKSNTEKFLMKLLKSPAIMAPGISTIFLTQNPKELCDRLKKLLREKPAGKSSEIIDEKNIAIAGKLLKFKCICTKQHKILLQKCLN